MIGIYYRISTEEQILDMQINAVENWLKENHPNEKTRVYKDIGISGATMRRPGFNKLIKHAETGKITHIVVYKLDRLTRDAVTAIRLVLRFDDCDVQFSSVTQPMFSHGTPFRHAIIAIFAELAQMEREMIVERVKAGLDAAKKRGVKLGQPIKATPEVIKEILRLKDDDNSYRVIASELNISIGLVSKVLNEQSKLLECNP